MRSGLPGALGVQRRQHLIRVALGLDGGPDAIVDQLRQTLFPEDFAGLVAAFVAEARTAPEQEATE